MGRKKILERRLARLQAKKTKLTERALASNDVAEVRSINEDLTELNEEITETQELMKMLPGQGRRLFQMEKVSRED